MLRSFVSLCYFLGTIGLSYQNQLIDKTGFPSRFYPVEQQMQQGIIPQDSIQSPNFNLPNGAETPNDPKNLSPVDDDSDGEEKQEHSVNLNRENNSLFSRLRLLSLHNSNHKNEDEDEKESLKSNNIKKRNSSGPTFSTARNTNRELLDPTKIYESLGNFYPPPTKPNSLSSESLNNEKTHYDYNGGGGGPDENVDLGESLRMAWLFNHLLGQGGGENRDKRNSGYICHFKLCQFGSSGKRRIFPAISQPKVRNSARYRLN